MAFNPKRKLSALLGQRPKIYNSLLLNVLGLQVIRILLDKLFQTTRLRIKAMVKSYHPTVRSLARTLQQDGIVILNDFLPPKVFNEIVKEFEKSFASPDAKVYRRRSGPILLEDIRINYKASEKATLNNVRGNNIIREVIEAASGIKIRLEPTCVMQTASQPEVMPQQLAVHGNAGYDTEQIWHQDHIYPVYKAWLYVGHVDEKNGAFQYGKNSHRLNFRRLSYEYRRSLYLLESFKRFFKIPAENIFQNRIVMDPATKASLLVSELTATGGPNTLVIANTLGQHRRGVFEAGAARKLVHLDFRKLDSVLNSVPGLNKVVNLDNFTG